MSQASQEQLTLIKLLTVRKPLLADHVASEIDLLRERQRTGTPSAATVAGNGCPDQVGVDVD